MIMTMDPENLSAEVDTTNQIEVDVSDVEELENGLQKKVNEVEFGKEKPEVKRRIKALKQIQVDIAKTDACFYKEIHALECKYLPKYLTFFEKRKDIVSGGYEPNDEECIFVEESDSEGETDKDKGDNPEPVVPINPATEEVNGIPDFWLKVFYNADEIHDLMEDCDEPILKHLTDITVEMMEIPMGFTLLFHFSPNEYFTNSVLTKTYEMNCDVDEDDPFQLEGPEINKCKGCTIDWVEGKNVTVKTIKKRQKHKGSHVIRTVSKTVKAPSFFNFFNPPKINTALPMDDEIQMEITNDFEIGQLIRERIIPRAVLYYTGEALEEDSEEEEEQEEEEDDDDGDDEEDGDGGFKVPLMGSRTRHGRKCRSVGLPPSEDCNCKQQ